MVRERSIVFVVVVAILSLVSMVQAQDRQNGGPGGPPPMYDLRLAPPINITLPLPLMRQQAEELRARAREAQELSDRLRRQADELDQMANQQMDRGGGSQDVERVKRELAEIKEGVGRAEREGRRQEADELRRRAEELMGRFQRMPPDPGMYERQEIKRQIERLRNEAQMAKEQGRLDDSTRVSQEADRLEQQLREQGAREQGEFGRPMPPEVQDILRAAEQAEREGRMDDARGQREKAEIVARQMQERERQGSGQPGGQFKDELVRGVEELKKEIGRLWQAVNEMRNRPKEDKPM